MAAKTVVEGLVLEYPDDPVFALKTGNLYGRLGNYHKAVFYLKRSFDISPSSGTGENYFCFIPENGQAAEAMVFINWLSGDPGHQLPHRYKNADAANHRAGKKDPHKYRTMKEIAEKYMQMGNKDGAKKYNEIALRVSPASKKAGFATTTSKLIGCMDAKIFKKVSRKQCMEFGQVLVLVCIGLGLYHKEFSFCDRCFLGPAITMLIPRIFSPLRSSGLALRRS